MADGVSGVITKQNLDWNVGLIDDGEHGYVSYTFNFNQNGTFFLNKRFFWWCWDESYVYKGTWKLNNLGNISFVSILVRDVVERLSSTVYDKDDGGEDWR